MSPPLGQIGRYELLARLAAGGMGEVFLARVTGTRGFEKRVVIKRILPHLAGDPDFVRRFTDEGKLVVQLRHAGIAQVLDMGEEDGVTYIAMEHIDGRDLGELAQLARSGQVDTPLPLLISVVCKLLEALDYAHHATDRDGRPMGIIHRDVSPSNVMISKTGEVKLLDFGIAKIAERLGGSTTGAIRGKYSYMSPQQAAGGELDPRSDLFSVGVLVWELIAGARPFDGPNDLVTLDRIRFHEPGTLAAVAPGVPEDVVAIVDKLLSKDPDDRFASADEALRAAQGYLQRVGAVVSARDLAAWVRAVLETLPPALRDRPDPGLSLDDALRLGLGSHPGSAPGPATAAAALTPHTRTHLSQPPPSSPGPAAAPAQGPEGDATSATDASSPASSAPPTTATGPPPSRRRTGFVVLLVTLNVALLAAVAWLVLRLSEDDPAPRPAPPAAADTARGPEPDAGRPSGTSAAAEPAPDALIAGSGPEDTADSEVAAVVAVDAAAAPEVEAEPPVLAGAAFGAALAAEADLLLVEDVTATVRAVPAGAQIAVVGMGQGQSPRVLSLRPGTLVRGRASLPGHHPRAFSFVAGEQDGVFLRLEPVAKGEVSFRFFPANAKVLIDGKLVDTGGRNLVTRSLAVGSHRLVLVGPSGARSTTRFEVRAGKTTNLRTINVAGD